MRKTVVGIVAGLAMVIALSGCATLIVGGGTAVVADKVIEDQEGGDGLF